LQAVAAVDHLAAVVEQVVCDQLLPQLVAVVR
jgi:hypothetical protein